MTGSRTTISALAEAVRITHMSTRSGISGIVAAAALLTGCGGGPDGQATTANAERALASIRGQRDELTRLETQLVYRCLDSKGFTVHPPVTPPADAAALTARTRLVAPSVQVAKTEGYGQDPQRRGRLNAPEAATGQQEWDALPQQTRDAAGQALFGDDSKMINVEINGVTVATGSTGCYADVRKQLYGSLKEYLRLSEVAANQINALSADGGSQDPTWVTAKQKWSQCMATAGFAGLRESRDAQKRVASRYDTATHAQARRFEFDIATADATCAADLRLQTIYDEAYSRANKKVLGDNESELVAWSELVSQALHRARIALGAAK
jgi:hypothetical protein